MAVTTEPTEHWIKKMKSVFRPWDIDAGSKGYVTEEDFKKRVPKTLEKFPDFDAKQMYERSHRHWVDHCNLGVEMPEGYRLTEAQYVQNMWLNIHRPSFKEQLRQDCMDFMQRVDKEKKGHLTKEDAKAIAPKVVKDHDHPKTQAVFDAVDKEKTGKVTHEQVFEAQLFFFTDKEDKDHPYNHIRGPLD